MSKLTIHCQQVPGWVQAWVERTGAGWVKGIDSFPNIPGVKTIGRTYMPDNESNNLVWQGTAGAEQWFYRWLPVYRANSHVWCWEGPNEPQPMSDPAFRRALDEFTVRLVQLMSAEGLRLVGHNWSVGWPDVGHAPEFRNSINALAQGGHYLGVHEYAAPAVWDGEGWLTMRFPKTVQELVSAGVMIPSILITECGIDGGVIGQPRTGWKTFVNEDMYVTQLVWYEFQLQQYPYVEAATIFTAGPYGDWLDFEVTEPLAWKLADALNVSPPLPTPSPSPSPPPPSGDVEYIWYDGTKVDEATFREEFGDFQIVRDPNAKYKIVRLKAVASSQSFWFYLLDKDGNPMPENSEAIVLSWPTAPALPESGWDNKGITAPLKANGGGEHIFGGDAKYWPPEGGPHNAWVYGVGQSDKFANFGWLGGTQYNHIDVAAMEVDAEPSPSPQPGYYYLFYSSEPEEGGYIIAQPEPVNDQLPEGTEVTLTAFANPGWKFSHWSDAAGVAETNPLIIPMTKDWAIAANFLKEEGEINVPAAIENGHSAMSSIGSALINLGESAADILEKFTRALGL